MLQIDEITALRSAFGRDGVAHRSLLDARGISASRLRHHLLTGSVLRVIRGWYALSEAPRPAIRALELGGRLTCVSALPAIGLWTPPSTELHLDLGAHSSGRRLHRAIPDEAVVPHWSGRTEWEAHPEAVRNPRTVLRHVLLCQPPDIAVAVLDSALRVGLLGRHDVNAMFDDLPERCIAVLADADASAESGLESIARFRLRRAGYRVTPQAVVCSGRFRVDLLIDGWLAVELDGRQFHSSGSAFSADRRRDAALLTEGILTLRFSWSQVLFEWEAVSAAIEQAYRQNHHR